jgi:hypothetical protein
MCQPRSRWMVPEMLFAYTASCLPCAEARIPILHPVFVLVKRYWFQSTTSGFRRRLRSFQPSRINWRTRAGGGVAEVRGRNRASRPMYNEYWLKEHITIF